MRRSNLAERPAPDPPSDADPLYAEACRLWAAGRRGDAIQRLDAALRLKPDSPDALVMGGYMLGELGRPEAALRFYRRALDLDPLLVVAHANSGKLLVELRRPAEALEAFDAAVALKPADADAWNGRAGALRELGRLEDSLVAARRALALRPEFAEAAINLGNALLKLDRMEDALKAYRRACALRPGYAAALCGEALALRNLGRYGEALAAFEAAEALGSREAVAGKGCLLLTLGDFTRGFEGYEARWLSGKSLADALGKRFPTWSGPGSGQERVLVLNDHGLGDTIQFVRYLPLMAAAGVEATFVCPPNLHRLLKSTIPGRLVETPPDESFDAQIAVSSLPRAFRTSLETVPATAPYLSADLALAARWAERIGPAGFKVGMVWQGNPHPEADRARSFPLAAAAPLGTLPGVRLISLQKGLRRGATRRPAEGNAGRNARRGFRFRSGRLRRHRRPDGASRPRRDLRHLGRPPRRRAGAAGLGRAEERRRMALDDRARRFAMVSDDAALPPAETGRLDGGVRRHGGRAVGDARAAASGAGGPRPLFDRRRGRSHHDFAHQAGADDR